MAMIAPPVLSAIPARCTPAEAVRVSANIRSMPLIGSIATPRLTPSCRPWLRLRHALLAAMLAALILLTFQIVFSGHRDHTLFSQHFPDQQA